MLRPAFAILDETDSGLDIDAVRVVSKVNKVAAKASTGILVITHYQRILNYIKPGFVHILFGGRIVEHGGPELVDLPAAKGTTGFAPSIPRRPRTRTRWSNTPLRPVN